MNPKIHYLLELARLFGRFSNAIDSGDTNAFVNLLKMIRDITDDSIRYHETKTKRVYIDTEVDDDDL